MKALVLNALGRAFEYEDVEIAAPQGREVLVDAQASGLCHTDLLLATHDIAPTPPARRRVEGDALRPGVLCAAIGGQKRVVGVNYGSTSAKRDIPIYAQLYLHGRMNLDDLVSKRIALRDVNDGYAALKDGVLNRVVVTSF